MPFLLGATYNWSFALRPNDPTGVFVVDVWNIAVPLIFAIVSKLAQTVVPVSGTAVPFEPKLSRPGFGRGP
jgi:hypothetical protein